MQIILSGMHCFPQIRSEHFNNLPFQAINSNRRPSFQDCNIFMRSWRIYIGSLSKEIEIFPNSDIFEVFQNINSWNIFSSMGNSRSSRMTAIAYLIFGINCISHIRKVFASLTGENKYFPNDFVSYIYPIYDGSANCNTWNIISNNLRVVFVGENFIQETEEIINGKSYIGFWDRIIWIYYKFISQNETSENIEILESLNPRQKELMEIIKMSKISNQTLSLLYDVFLSYLIENSNRIHENESSSR